MECGRILSYSCIARSLRSLRQVATLRHGHMARRSASLRSCISAPMVCEHIWLRYKNFDPSCSDPIQKFGMSTWGLTLIFDPVPSTYIQPPAGAKGSGATCHMAMPQCCYLAKGAKRPSHTTNMLTFLYLSVIDQFDQPIWSTLLSPMWPTPYCRPNGWWRNVLDPVHRSLTFCKQFVATEHFAATNVCADERSTYFIVY